MRRIPIFIFALSLLFGAASPAAAVINDEKIQELSTYGSFAKIVNDYYMKPGDPQFSMYPSAEAAFQLLWNSRNGNPCLVREPHEKNCDNWQAINGWGTEVWHGLCMTLATEIIDPVTKGMVDLEAYTVASRASLEGDDYEPIRKAMGEGRALILGLLFPPDVVDSEGDMGYDPCNITYYNVVNRANQAWNNETRQGKKYPYLKDTDGSTADTSVYLETADGTRIYNVSPGYNYESDTFAKWEDKFTAAGDKNSLIYVNGGPLPFYCGEAVCKRVYLMRKHYYVNNKNENGFNDEKAYKKMNAYINQGVVKAKKLVQDYQGLVKKAQTSIKKSEEAKTAAARAELYRGSSISLPLPLSDVTPQAVVGRVIGAILGVVGSVALLMFVYGGIRWMTAAGNPENVKTAKTTLVYASLGLLVIFFAYALINFLITKLG